MPRDLEKDYELPNDHLEKINRMCGLDQHSPQDVLPDAVRLQYIRDRVRADQIGLRFSDGDLWNIVCRSNVTHTVELPEKAPTSVFDLWKTGDLKTGDYVMCKWRNELEFKVPGKILGFEPPGRPIVQFIGDESAQERILNVNNVIPAPPDYEPPNTPTSHRDGKNKRAKQAPDEQLAPA